MSLFNNIQVNPNVIPFIQKGEGVGIVKVNGVGKCSAIIRQNQVVMDSYESNNNSIVLPIQQIVFLDYKEGNFINEPKMTIGMPDAQFELAGVDNNDDEFKRFFDTLLNIKNNEPRINQSRQTNNQQTKSSSNKSNDKNSKLQTPIDKKLNSQTPKDKGPMPQPYPHITNPNKLPPQPKNYETTSSPEFNQTNPLNDYENSEITEETQTIQIDPADEIRKYYQLKEDGIITEEEFNQKKKQLLEL